MPSDRITANLPSRNFDATIAFYGRLGFSPAFHDSGWLILERGPLVLEFFPHPDLEPKESWFSACIRVDDIDNLLKQWQALEFPDEKCGFPRLTGINDLPGVPRMFALLDEDGSLLRCLENGGGNGQGTT